jgi:hypothetical protein
MSKYIFLTLLSYNKIFLRPNIYFSLSLLSLKVLHSSSSKRLCTLKGHHDLTKGDKSDYHCAYYSTMVFFLLLKCNDDYHLHTK